MIVAPASQGTMLQVMALLAGAAWILKLVLRRQEHRTAMDSLRKYIKWSKTGREE